jgi:1-phosphofructokinase
MSADRHDVCIFAPALFVAVTIEQSDNGADDIHIHPAGQGFWIARTILHLGGEPIICVPLGGEAGRVIEALAPEWGIDMRPVSIAAPSPAYVHDRRSGERVVLAEGAPPVLDRHERDDVYAAMLDNSLAAGIAVITGRVDDIFSPDVYRRFGSDFASNGVRVVGDLHGEELAAFLEGGPIDVLKVSDEDLLQDEAITDTDPPSLVTAIEKLEAAGAKAVVVSRGADPVIARFRGITYTAKPPKIEAVDFRGAGDSMTAALATGLVQNLSPEQALRLATAAGTANVARHGLGTASADLITQLVERVEIARLDS